MMALLYWIKIFVQRLLTALVDYTNRLRNKENKNKEKKNLNEGLTLIHFIKEMDIKLLEEFFVDRTVHVFRWPMADGESVDEQLVINHSDWLSLMKEYKQRERIL